jgi:large subunit ribosomal protein L6
MSRLGKQSVKIPAGTEVKIEDNFIFVKSQKGELKERLHELVKIRLENDEIIVSVENPKIKKERAFWGLYRSLINNMVVGVNKGFEKKLEVNGVGYKVSVSGKKLTLNVGYSHPVEFPLPDGIEAIVEGNIITIKGIDKQLVGETAAQVRKIRKPEPYKGKGIKYVDEVVRRKEGKTAVKGE